MPYSFINKERTETDVFKGEKFRCEECGRMVSQTEDGLCQTCWRRHQDAKLNKEDATDPAPPSKPSKNDEVIDKAKLYQGDKCPKCGDGTMEVVNGPSGDYMQCDKCDYIYR